MNDDQQPTAIASTVRRSVMSLGRRLKLERPPGGRTSLELSVLGHLHHRGQLTPGDLAAAERVQPQTLTRTLTSLEAAGLIARAGHPRDGRRAAAPAGKLDRNSCCCYTFCRGSIHASTRDSVYSTACGCAGE